MNERTLVLIKPDAVKRRLVGTILARYEQRGLTIEALRCVSPPEPLIALHYAEHANNEALMSILTETMAGRPTVAAIISGPSAIAIVRSTNGATDPVKAAPGTIRGDFANYISANMVHGSDSDKSALEEIPLWFGTNA
jgi:nucleoside-diphosphate kinase